MARESLSAGNFAPLVDYGRLGRDAMVCAPTPDHYLPLMYVLAQHMPNEAVSFTAGLSAMRSKSARLLRCNA
jgi:4,5-DOPA dioxygenase extradiol